mgnify:CR=1 FL=1
MLEKLDEKFNMKVVGTWGSTLKQKSHKGAISTVSLDVGNTFVWREISYSKVDGFYEDVLKL